jgi:pimeloyl-ACP methyl ester carboxylesterase
MQQHVATDSVVSHDGTPIVYHQLGRGPGVVVLHGANVSARSFMRLAGALADDYTVYLPERRGHHIDPGKHYGICKEVEDLDALLAKTGARNVFGISAGGLIALQAARTITIIEKIALYEPALLPSGSTRIDWLGRYDREMARGEVAAALVTAMRGLALGPPVMNAMPRWLLVALTNMAMTGEEKRAEPGDVTMRMLAPTLHYDMQLLAEMTGTLESFREVRAAVLLLGGANGLPYLKPSMDALERSLPHVDGRVEFPRLDHGGACDPSETNRASDPGVVAAELRRFFACERNDRPHARGGEPSSCIMYRCDPQRESQLDQEFAQVIRMT